MKFHCNTFSTAEEFINEAMFHSLYLSLSERMWPGAAQFIVLSQENVVTEG